MSVKSTQEPRRQASGTRTRGVVGASLLFGALAAAAWAASTGTTSLWMPQGESAPVASGDYVSSTGGLNTFYRYFIEVPAGLSRLSVDLFDPDLGSGGAATEAAANRDRDRGDGFSSDAVYRLYDPSGTLVVTETNTTLTSFDNQWVSIWDTGVPIHRGLVTNTTGSQNATQITINVPAGVSAGDLLIAVVQKNGIGNPSAPIGWTTIDEGACPGNQCWLEAFQRTATGSETNVTFNWTGGARAIGAVFRYSGASPTLVSGFNTGSNNAPTAPSVNTTAANSRVLRLMVADDNQLTGSPYPAGHVGRYGIQVDNSGVADLSGAAADEVEAAAGPTGPAAFSLNTNENWRALTIAIAPSGASPAAGHWELQVDMTTGGGNDINALGIRAHDGDPTGGGSEIPIYYDSQSQFGTNDEAGAPSMREYDLYPWITAGCTCLVSDFDFDNGNGTGLGTPPAQHGRIQMVRPQSTDLDPPTTFPSPSVLHADFVSTTLSDDNAWQNHSVSGWTTDSDAVHYGIWRTDATISEYSGPNSNYSNVYYSNFEGAGGAPGANPTPNTFRVYFPNDAGNAPAKPYLEQFARYISGPQVPNTGQTTTMEVTVRLVNPTTYALSFSSPTNLVTIPLSGAAQIAYQAPAVTNQGVIVSEPANGATSGSIVWNPQSVPALSASIVHFQVDVTPTVNNQRILILQAPDITPSLAGTRGFYLDETGNTSQSRATIRLGPICELAVTEDAPTRAVVDELRADLGRDGVVVSWTTATEDATAGFRLFAFENGEWVQVGPHIAADPRAVAGARYRILDPGADGHTERSYALVEIDRRGTTRYYGPFEVTPTRDGSLAPDTFDGRAEVRPTAVPAAELARLRQATARVAAEFATVPAVPRFRDRRTNGSTSAIKIRVDTNGLYGVSAASIAAASGLAEPAVRELVRNRQVRLESSGAPIGIDATSDGSLLYFYGQARGSIYGDERVYWLRLGSALTMGKGTVAPFALDGPTYSTEHAAVEEDAFAVSVLPLDPESDYWFWDVLEAGDPTYGTRTFQLPLPHATAIGGDGEIAVRLRGASETGVPGEHQVEVRFDGQYLGTVQLTGLDEAFESFPLPAQVVAQGGPFELELHAVLAPGVPYSGLFVDGFEVDYPKLQVADADRIEATANGATLGLAGFSQGDLLLYDVTNPLRPERLTGAAVRGGLDGYTLGFRATPGHRYLATTPTAARVPLAVESAVANSLRSGPGAEYVVVTHASLAAGAQQLADYRAAGGLSTRVATLGEIDDEFGFGMPSPNNIRAFLAWAAQNWAVPPRFAVLVGEGTYDYRGLTGLGGNLVPAILMSTADSLVAADQRYGDFDSDGIPEVAVGRLPVLTPAELGGYLARLQQVEAEPATSGWRQRAIVVADDAGNGDLDFKPQAEAAASRLPIELTRSNVFLSEMTDAAARAAVQANLSAGGSLFLYYGHAGLDRLADESLLSSGTVPALQNVGREPFLAALTCSINRFELPGFSSLGEELVRSATGGAIAVWAPAGESSGGEAPALGQLFASAVYRQPEARLGDLLRGVATSFAAGGGSTHMLSIYQLLGDPAMRMTRPELESAGGPTPPATE